MARGKQGRTFLDRAIGGEHVRLLIAPIPGGGAVQVARSLNEVDSVLRALLLILAAITAAGVALAAVLGGLVSRAALRPVRRFTKRTESIAGQLDLSKRLPVERDDELGRLAASFNTTLDALERSVAAQRQLVADASHELRTPLASLRTNLEVISGDKQLPPEERRELLRDLIEQADELNLLVADVVELARRGEPDVEASDEVELHALVAAAVQRAQRHRPDVRFVTELQPTAVTGVARRLDRAVANLLDNAAKWSPVGRGRGGDSAWGHAHRARPWPGDRSRRSAVRLRPLPPCRRRPPSLPGSGLGLAIVRQVAEAHGAEARAGNAPGGGAVLTLHFPGATSSFSSYGGLRAGSERADLIQRTMRNHRIRPSQVLAACAAVLALGVAGCGSDSGSGSTSNPTNANRPARFSLTAAQRSCLQKAGVPDRTPARRPAARWHERSAAATSPHHAPQCQAAGDDPRRAEEVRGQPPGPRPGRPARSRRPGQPPPTSNG